MDADKMLTQSEEKNSEGRTKTILWYANVIIFSQSLFSYAHSTLQTSLTPIYDMNRQELDYTMKSRRLPLFLPEKTMVSGSEYVDTYTTLKDSVISESSSEYEVAIRNGESNDDQKDSASEIEEGWALLTGASRGIGRALAIELARWKIPIILVARNNTKLRELSKEIKDCYGVPTRIIVSDLNRQNAAEKLYEKVLKEGYRVDMLITNAGLGSTGSLVHMSTAKIAEIVQINALSTSQLISLFGEDMKSRRNGRIMTISSIAGAFPGIPNAAIYAATKAYQNNLFVSIRKELEQYGVGVTNILPGPVADTQFAATGNMEKAFVWMWPSGVLLTPPVVASSAVHAMIAGHATIVQGWFNVVSICGVMSLLPARVSIIIGELAWNPLPFNIPFF